MSKVWNSATPDSKTVRRCGEWGDGGCSDGRRNEDERARPLHADGWHVQRERHMHDDQDDEQIERSTPEMATASQGVPSKLVTSMRRRWGAGEL